VAHASATASSVPIDARLLISCAHSTDVMPSR
jgi:hypothetical protein